MSLSGRVFSVVARTNLSSEAIRGEDMLVFRHFERLKTAISLFVCTVCLYLILVCTLLEKVLNKNNTVIRQSVVKHSEFFKFFLWCEMLTDVLKIKSQFQIIISSMI